MNEGPPSLSLARRAFLAGLGGACAFACGGREHEDIDFERWISAAGADERSYGLVVAGSDGSQVLVPTGFRGHGVAQRPGIADRVVMIGRRPGTFAVEVDVHRGEIVSWLELPTNRRLQGHGCFSTDGRLLLTTEADPVTGAGTVAVRDADTFELLRELDTRGIGPHELALMPDGQTVVVANGGILTRPETGADKLNLDTMRSSLVFLDLDSGALLDEALLAEDKASIRHLHVCEDGTVAVAMQVQREALEHTDPVPLLAIHAPGRGLQTLDEGLELSVAMRDYAAAVAVHERTRVAGITSPQGNLALFWHLDSGALVGHHEFYDVSGITVSPQLDAFVLSGASGQLRLLDAETLTPLDGPPAYADVRWDNHMAAMHG